MNLESSLWNLSSLTDDMAKSYGTELKEKGIQYQIFREFIFKLRADKEKSTKEYSGKDQKIIKSMWSPQWQKGSWFFKKLVTPLTKGSD